MSELKAFDVGLGRYTEDGSPCIVAFDADQNPRLLNEQIYLKADADKVIAEKDAKIAELKDENARLMSRPCYVCKEEQVKALENKFQELEGGTLILYNENNLRHNKCKRCLAMAEWCEVTALWCYQAANTLPKGFRATLYGKPVMIEPSRLFKRSARLNNWVNRWRKLAEEPTWAKFLQLIHKEAK